MKAPKLEDDVKMCGMLQGSGQGSAEMGEGLYLPWSPQQEFVGVAAASSCSWAGQRISRSGGALSGSQEE